MVSKLFVGRKKEYNGILNAIKSEKKELIAITGKRGIGKTFLMLEIMETLKQQNNKNYINLLITGKRNVSYKNQLKGIEKNILKQLNIECDLKDWDDFFSCIKKLLENNKDKKIILYIDEFPWFNVRGSNFIDEFGSFWNILTENNLKIILTGSEVSWMNKQVIRNKGGLYHKTTERFHLKPFDLMETREYLNKSNSLLNDEQIIEYYLITGGIVRYLQKINFGRTIKENAIMLYNNNNYFDDFFNNSFTYKRLNLHKIIIELFKERITLSFVEIKNEILKHAKKLKEKRNIADSTIYETLKELVETDILKETTIKNKQRNKKYTICDLFCFYYLRLNNFEKIINIFDQRFDIISGHAFEILTLNNIHLIVKYLSRNFIYDENLVYKYQDEEVQIDLVLEYRSLKNTISLIECKNYNEIYELDKKEEDKIIKRVKKIESLYNNKISVDIIIVSVKGVNNNVGMVINDVSLLNLMTTL